MLGAAKQLPATSLLALPLVFDIWSVRTAVPVGAYIFGVTPSSSIHTSTDCIAATHPSQSSSRPCCPPACTRCQQLRQHSSNSSSSISTSISPQSSSQVTTHSQNSRFQLSPQSSPSSPLPFPSHTRSPVHTMQSSVHPLNHSSASSTTPSAGYSTAQQTPSHHVAPKSSRFGPLFDNPWCPFQDKSLGDAWEAYKAWKKLDTTSLGYLSYNNKPTLEDFKVAFPVHSPDYSALANPPADAVQALWVGHASVLVQMEGVTFITDPLFSERCSFSQWFGPRRVVRPPYEIEDPKMPDLDFVVISHNHYDHLDLGSVKRLYKRYGDKLRWYVPLGLKAWFKDMGIKNVVEADWWEEVQHPGTNIKLALTPAQHWSARGIFDRRRTLWGGWAVLGEKKKFWFAGDTGYCPVFKEIGERYGPFDLSAIPIGAYDPRDMLQQQHVNPAEAVQMHMDVKSKRSISIHCCTYFLTFEPMDEPPMKLRQELKLQNLSEEVFVTLQHGEILQTADGVDLNSPKLLGHASHGTQSAPAWTPAQTDGVMDMPGIAAAAYHTKADAAGSKK